MADYIRLIDPESGKVIFDSDTVIPEQLDPERDHIIAGPGWSLQTPEQVDRELRKTHIACPKCNSLVLTQDDDMWTCQICKTTWPVGADD